MMQLTPQQLAMLQAQQQPQGAIQQAQGAPQVQMPMQPPGMSQGMPQGAQMEQMKKIMTQKFMALPPASKEKFLAAIRAQKQQK